LGEVGLLNSEALTKIQSIILITIVVVAAVGGALAYVLLSGEQQSAETIKIGVIADIDNTEGKSILQGAKLAAEQVNAEGGVLGMNFEIVAEDDDSEALGEADPNFASKAFAKLISVDGANFIISLAYGMMYREISYEYEKILFTVATTADELTQGVLDNYDRYKYYFRTGAGNETAAVEGVTESIVVCRNFTVFNKIAFLYNHKIAFEPLVSDATEALEEQGFEVVLSEAVAFDTIDYSGYFARAEAAGAEILYPIIVGTAGIQFVKEYYDRQSPMVMWGLISQGARTDFWEATEGKCEHIAIIGYPVVVGYPLTSKTVATKDAYMERWGEEISGNAAVAYDTVRFILADAIERAGTTETEAVIEALEKTDIETSLCRRFVFTSSHDIMIGREGPNRLSEDYFFVALFQWQDGVQVPVYPIELMEEAGATYTFPDWPGPWDNIS
jgi:branched-chain amino acid transport system substrate-binding protein